MLAQFTWQRKSDCKYNYETKQTNKQTNNKHFVSPINLIIAIIINYRLRIERSFLEFTVIILIFFFFNSAPTLSLEILKKSFAFAPFASLSSCWLRDHARCTCQQAGLLFSGMYARVKSSLCLRPFPCKKMCTTEKMIIISFSWVFQKFGYFFVYSFFFHFLQYSVHSFCCHVLPSVSTSLKKLKAWTVLVERITRP